MLQPFCPLPDLPRSPDSDLSRIICLVLEHRDMEALTRLPDMLLDLGRDADAKELRAITARAITHLGIIKRPYDPSWSDRVYGEILDLFFWDLFSWEQCLGILSRRIATIRGTGGYAKLDANDPKYEYHSTLGDPPPGENWEYLGFSAISARAHYRRPRSSS